MTLKSINGFELEPRIKPSLQIVGRDVVMRLPVLATAADVREVIRFLKRHPEGITAVQAMDAFRKRIFDARKVSAYEFWGIVARSGDRLKLSSLGWDLANRLSPESEIYRTVLQNTAPYHAGLEWIREQNLELVTHLDIGDFWRAHHAHVLEGDSEGHLEAYAASFFHICHAAEVGTVTIGRKGQPTRLHIYPRELSLYFNKAEGLPVPSLSIASTRTQEEMSARIVSARLPRVFISHRQSSNLIKHITDALELADFQYETLDRGEKEFRLDQSWAVLRRCEAAVIVITEDDCDKNGGVDDLLLIQIGAALIHFEQRVLLLVKRGLVLSASLTGVPCCEIDGDVTWDAVVQVVKSLKRFRLEE